MATIFDTKTMLAAVKEMKPARTFLRDTFFSNPTYSDTKVVEVDIVKGKRSSAPYVNPKIAGQVIEGTGFTTRQHEAPLLKPKMVTEAEELLKRLPGENPYAQYSPEDRAAVKLGEDLAKLDDMITRTEEIQAAEALFTGKINIKGEGIDILIDFGFTNTITLTGTDKWDDFTNSNPIADLNAWRSDIVKKSGINPTHCIMATSVASNFINNPKIMDMLDVRNVEIGKIKPELLPNGVTYLGTITLLGIDIYTYEEWYINDLEQEVSMVPEGAVLLASTKADFRRAYGAIVDAELGTFMEDRVPKSWYEKDPSGRIIQLLSRPLLIPTRVDSYYAATVI